MGGGGWGWVGLDLTTREKWWDGAGEAGISDTRVCCIVPKVPSFAFSDFSAASTTLGTRGIAGKADAGLQGAHGQSSHAAQSGGGAIPPLSLVGSATMVPNGSHLVVANGQRTASGEAKGERGGFGADDGASAPDSTWGGRGGVWFATKKAVDGGFSTSFRVRPGSGASYVAFVVQNASLTATEPADDIQSGAESGVGAAGDDAQAVGGGRRGPATPGGVPRTPSGGRRRDAGDSGGGGVRYCPIPNSVAVVLDFRFAQEAEARMGGNGGNSGNGGDGGESVGHTPTRAARERADILPSSTRDASGRAAAGGAAHDPRLLGVRRAMIR